MFTTLINWLAGLWSTFKAVLKTIWDGVNAWMVWIVATLTGFLVISENVTQFVMECIQQLASFAGTMSGALDGNAASGTANSLLGQMNVFFPVAEGFILISTLMLVTVAAWTYRLIKSWIPTLS